MKKQRKPAQSHRGNGWEVQTSLWPSTPERRPIAGLSVAARRACAPDPDVACRWEELRWARLLAKGWEKEK
jgi:hypothetical protein